MAGRVVRGVQILQLLGMHDLRRYGLRAVRVEYISWSIVLMEEVHGI